MSVIYLASVVGSVGLLARFIDRRPFVDYGFRVNRSWGLDFGFGEFLGAFMLSGILLTERMAGWITVTGVAVSSDSLPISLAVLLRLLRWVVDGVNEELVFRGYQLKNLAEGLVGKRIGAHAALVLAVVLSSTLFGLAHLANDKATLFSTINIVVGGLLLSLPVLWTGELAISIGLHITWNLFEGTVYGFPVSGTLPRTHLLTIRQSGPELWTGGAFGPEAGLIGTVWMLIACALVATWVRRRHRRAT